MEDDFSTEIMLRETNRSRTDRILDSSIALALACACSGGIDVENDDFDMRIEKLCRVRTAETTDTNSWNDYVRHPLFVEEGSVLSLNSRTSSIDSLMWVEVDEEIEPTEKTQIFFHTIKREDTKEETEETVTSVQKLKSLLVQKKSVWVPIVKKKVAKIIQKYNLKDWQQKAKKIRKYNLTDLQQIAKNVRKYNIKGLQQLAKRIRKFNLNEWQRGKQISSEKAPRHSILTSVALRLKSTEKELVPSTDGLASGRRESVSTHFIETLNSSQDAALSASYEVSRVATNYVSIIDHSILLPDDVTPMADNESGLKPVALNALPIRTYSLL